MRTLTNTVLQWFVNREQALRRFKEMLASRDPARVLLVEGDAGIGKTWLLQRLCLEAKVHGLPACVIDFVSGEAFDSLLIVQRVARALGSFRFSELNQTLDRATELRVVLKVESSGGGGGITFAGDATVHGDVAGRDIIKDNNFFFIGDDPQVSKIWLERINEAFLADLERMGLGGNATAPASPAPERGAVLLFDSFERGPNEARAWVEHRLLQRVGEGRLPGVRVVIAGRQVLDLPSAWQGLLAELRLGLLPAAEVRRYLTDKRGLVLRQENIATICDITQGRPDLVALIAESNPEALPEQPDPDRLLEILIKGILDRAEAPVPETLRVAAVPEWFDAALLADLLGTAADVDARIAALRAYTFVQADAQGFIRFAPAVRQVLLAAWQERPTEFLELHERARRHFVDRAQGAPDPQTCKEFRCQEIGHLLVIDERTARDRLRATFQEGVSTYQLAACERLLQRADAVESLADQTLNWLCYLRGRLALARNEYQNSAANLQCVLDKAEPDSELYALARWRLGQVNAEQGRWAEAIEQCEPSLRYFQGQAKGEPDQDGEQARLTLGQILLTLGDVHFMQAEALGGLIRPQLVRRDRWWRSVEIVPAFLVALPFVIYAWCIRRWRFLPPLHHGMNYRNWTLSRLLLTAIRWYRDAAEALSQTGQEALLVDARRRLAQAYYRIGWWRAARVLLDQVLGHSSVTTSSYRHALVRSECAAMDLRAGNVDRALEPLEESAEVFERYQDMQAQARAQALLGEASLAKGQFEHGLALFRASFEGSASVGDRLGSGLALHALWRFLERSHPTAEQAADIEFLIASVDQKTYLPRVQDRLAAIMESVVSLGLPLLVIVALTQMVASALQMTMPGLWAHLMSIETWFKVLWRVALAALVYTVGSSLFGLLLIVWAARQKLKPERLDTIVTSDDAIARYDYRGREVTRIPWREVQGVLSAERCLWRTPMSLFSRFWLYGPRVVFQMPSDSDVRATVSATPGAVAFLPIGCLENGIKPLPIGGTDTTGAIVRPFNLLVRGEPNELVRAWVDFCLGQRGQAVIAREGYAPVQPAAEAPLPPPAAGLSGYIRVAGSMAAQPLVLMLAEAFRDRYPGVQVDVQGGGSSRGIRQAGEGQVDVGVASRELLPSELDEYADLKILTLARESVVLVVHPDVPVDGLTKGQARGIFAGEITNWNQVGGPDKLIAIVYPQVGSRIRDAFVEMVMDGQELRTKNPAIQVPAVMRWYAALKHDIEEHLCDQNVQPIQRKLDVCALHSWLGIYMLSCPLLLGLGSLISYRLMELSLSLGVAVFAGPMLYYLGLVAPTIGVYWWLVLYPLRLRYTLVPSSRIPWVISGLGLGIVAFAFYMSYRQPYFPIRHWLDITVHSLGFLLILIGPLWILIAQEWEQPLALRGRAVYPAWIRGVAAVILLGAVLLTGIFVRRAVFFFYGIPMIARHSYGDYEGVIARCERLQEVTDSVESAYYRCALAYIKTQEHAKAVKALTHLIDWPGPTLARYRWHRARAYKAQDQIKCACADVRLALDAERWRLPGRYREDAERAWSEWQCDDLEDIGRCGESS